MEYKKWFSLSEAAKYLSRCNRQVLRYVEEGDLNGCNNPVTIPKYGVEKKLEIGENIIEFTPTGQGKVLYTCWMGMIYGNIVVVSDISQVSEDDVNTRTYDEIELYGDGNETGSEEIIIDLPLCCYGLYDVEDYEGETDSEE